MSKIRYAIAIILLGVMPAAVAGKVYKCVDASGAVAFQDQPCPTGATQSRVHLAPPPPADAATPLARAPSPPAETRPAEASSPPPAKPLPPMWVCRSAENGKQYFSRSGNPPVRFVPLGVLGYPGHSLAQAYGPGGIGVSAPGMRKIPVSHAPADALAGEYTTMQDTCVRASPEQTCAYLRKRFDEVQEKLDHARFKDEQARLQPQVDRLRNELGGC